MKLGIELTDKLQYLFVSNPADLSRSKSALYSMSAVCTCLHNIFIKLPFTYLYTISWLFIMGVLHRILIA